jgi:membrane dipeptidase
MIRQCLSASGVAIAAPMLNLGRCRLAGAEREYSVRTIETVGRSLVIDMLGLVTFDWSKLRRWHTHPDTFTARDLSTLRSSSINVFHPAVDLNSSEPYADTVRWLDNWNRLVNAHSHTLMRISSCNDLQAAKQSRKVGVLLGMQNSTHFRTPSDVADFFELGQRVSQLTYNESNAIGYGCTHPSDRGLTPFGASIVSAMNKCGMAIDVSHAGDRTTLDTFDVSNKPVLVTHSNCRSLTQHPRCKSDEVLKRMARAGGVIGITSIAAFVSQPGRATFRDVIAHYEHAIKVAGAEHVGLGSDTDVEGVGRARVDVAGLRHPTRVFDLTEALLARGYSESTVELILGGNFRRALTAIS